MESYFSSDFFVGNRQHLRELFRGTAPIVISANGLLQRGADGSFPFAQDASFWYLTGLNDPDIVLVIDRDEEYLIVPDRSTSRQTFDGSIIEAALSSRSGVEMVYDEADGWDHLEKRLRKVKHAATVAVPPAYIDTYGIYTNPARAHLVQRLKKANTDLELLDIGPHLIRMRMVKQPSEIKAIQAAIDITVASLKETFSKTKLRRYSHEYQIEAQITNGFRKRGSQGHAFDPIVASGQRACTLHYVDNDGPLSADELVVTDVGAQVEHYAADITRTFALGKPSRRQQAVHSAVCEVQDYAFSQLGTGILLKDYEHNVRQFLGEKLRELGLIKNINDDETRRYYPHATSHFLGLNVHDIGDYDRPLQAGTILTVEPGIYIAEEGIGVRIEDDVLITPDGIKNMSRTLSRNLG